LTPIQYANLIIEARTAHYSALKLDNMQWLTLEATLRADWLGCRHGQKHGMIGWIGLSAATFLLDAGVINLINHVRMSSKGLSDKQAGHEGQQTAVTVGMTNESTMRSNNVRKSKSKPVVRNNACYEEINKGTCKRTNCKYTHTKDQGTPDAPTPAAKDDEEESDTKDKKEARPIPKVTFPPGGKKLRRN
jgi:hypothetical protein